MVQELKDLFDGIDTGLVLVLSGRGVVRGASIGEISSADAGVLLATAAKSITCQIENLRRNLAKLSSSELEAFDAGLKIGRERVVNSSAFQLRRMQL